METPIIAQRSTSWGLLTASFAITLLIFATAFYASNYFNNQRVIDIRATQDNISTDILSLQTQFDLLQEQSCKDITNHTILPSELQTLANKLSYLEAQGGSANQAEVTRLKRLYSLLEIKDYLLTKQLVAQCRTKPTFILYFYSNKGDCTTECEKQGYALTALAQKYPQLRIYSFDYNLDVTALQTFISIHRIHNPLPALLINGKVYTGYRSPESIEKLLPRLKVQLKNTASGK